MIPFSLSNVILPALMPFANDSSISIKMMTEGFFCLLNESVCCFVEKHAHNSPPQIVKEATILRSRVLRIWVAHSRVVGVGHLNVVYKRACS
jgi:hypothetical protein